jgi:hypothetical protein
LASADDLPLIDSTPQVLNDRQHTQVNIDRQASFL